MSTHTAPPAPIPANRRRRHAQALQAAPAGDRARHRHRRVHRRVRASCPLITDWHNENDVHREVFVNIPGPLQVAFYTVIPVMLVWGAFRVRRPR